MTHLWPWRGWCGARSRADSSPGSGTLLHPTRTRSQCEAFSGSAGKTSAWPGDRRWFCSRRFQELVWKGTRCRHVRTSWCELQRGVLGPEKGWIPSLTVPRRCTPSPARALSTLSWSWRAQTGRGMTVFSPLLGLLEIHIQKKTITSALGPYQREDPGLNQADSLTTTSLL